MPPGRCAEMAGVVVGITRPNETVVRHLVPFFAGDFAGFATDANSRICEEPDLDVVAHVRMPTLIRTLCAFADHKSSPGSASILRAVFGILPNTRSKHRDVPRDAEHSTLEACAPCNAFILFLPSHGPRRFVLFGKTVLLDAKSLAHPGVHIC